MGDGLWVRETCRELEDGTFVYRSESDKPRPEGPWKNVRFVPKRSARIWLEVLEVRAERLQEITPEDVIAEGVERAAPGLTLVQTFARLWDGINGSREALSWGTNPWVWRILFRRVEAKRDQRLQLASM